MNLILHLPPETAARLREQSVATGKSPENLALDALQEQFSAQSPLGLSAAEWIEDMRVWSAGHSWLPYDVDDSRESCYSGSEE
jgi:hypothetical protein